MSYKDALNLAKVSVMAAKQQISIASDILDEYSSKEAAGLWSTLNAIDSMLFNIHYYIMDKFEEKDTLNDD